MDKIARNLDLQTDYSGAFRGARSRGFTVIEVLVAIAVIGVLITIMLPTISLVQESARKVVCASNTRQIGIGLNMFAVDNRELMPPSVFLPTTTLGQRAQQGPRPELMDIVRTQRGQYPSRSWGHWDGIGLLYSMEYLNAPDIYYCPSHDGNYEAERYEGKWGVEGDTEIVSNYLFRGLGPNGEQRLYQIAPKAAILTDTLRSYEDLNHEFGFNVLHAGLSVTWTDDTGSESIQSLLSRGSDGGDKSDVIVQAWSQLDGGGSSPTPED